MQVQYIRPGAAWLQYTHRWYLVVSHDGRVTDTELSKALYLIDWYESRSIPEDEAETALSIFYAFRVRQIMFEPARRAVRLSCDLLIHRDEPQGVEAVLTTVVRRSLDTFRQPDDWTQEVAYELAVSRADLTSDSTGGNSIDGDHWFDRFVQPRTAGTNEG